MGRLSLASKYLVVYCGLIFLEEYFYGVFSILWRNNLWVGRIGLYIELLFVFIFFRTFIKRPGLQKLINILTILALGMMTYMNSQAVWLSNAELEQVVYFVYLISVFVIYYIQVFNDEKVNNLFLDLGFMVGSILIISWSFVLLYHLFYNYSVFSEDPQIKYIHRVLTKVNLFKIVGYNLLYTLVLWVTRVSQK